MEFVWDAETFSKYSFFPLFSFLFFPIPRLPLRVAFKQRIKVLNAQQATMRTTIALPNGISID